MEHYRSLFATAAIMVTGLVATSPLVREQHSTPSKALVRSVASDSAASGDDEIWTDPPRYGSKLAVASDAGGRPDTVLGDALPKPATFTLLSPDTVALLASDDRGRLDAPQRIQAVRRHRAAKVATRARPTPNVESPPVAAPTASTQTVAAQPQQAARIDPIGDLLRGLGIGRDS